MLQREIRNQMVEASLPYHCCSYEHAACRQFFFIMLTHRLDYVLCNLCCWMMNALELCENHDDFRFSWNSIFMIGCFSALD
jgi:hypothetical protein